jgi:hypothetical protein
MMRMSERFHELAALIAIAILLSVSDAAAQGPPAQNVNVVNTPTVMVGNTPSVNVANLPTITLDTTAVAVKDPTSPALARVWSAIANGDFEDQSPEMTTTYEHPHGFRRAMVRHISVFCQFPAAAQAFMRAFGDSGIAPILITLTTIPFGPNFAYAIGSTPVELILDADTLTNFQFIRNDRSAGTANCGVWLNGYMVPQPGLPPVTP